MDAGPQPKFGLLLSLTLMNLVAIGLCIYGTPASKEPDDLTTGKSEGKLSFKQRIDPGVKAESSSRSGAVQVKSGSDGKMKSSATPEHAAKNIEPSNLSNAETSSEVLYFLDKKVVNEMLEKSSKLIDNYKKRVLPAVETINDKITKALHLEKYLDSYTSSAMGALDSVICPKETQKDKPKPVADTGVQVSDSKLAKPVQRKNKFFNYGAPSHVFRTVDLLRQGNVGGSLVRKVRPTFKYSNVHYWSNRKKKFLRKFKKQRKPIEEPQALPPNLLGDISSQDEAPIEGSNSQPTCQESVRDKIDNFDGSSFSLMCKTSNCMEDGEGQTMSQMVEPRSTNNDGTCFITALEIRNQSVNDNIDNVNGCETSIGLLGNKSQISPRTDSEETCFRMASDMQSPSVNINIDHLNDNPFYMKCGSSIGSLDGLEQSQSQISPRAGSGATSEIISRNDVMRQDVRMRPHDTVGNTVINTHSSTNSLELTSTALTTLEARKCRDKRALGINSILEMLDPKLDQKNMVENLCLMILKIFDAWSETQLSVVPSKVSISPSSSKKCIDYLSQRNSSSALIDVVPATKKGECSGLPALLNGNYSRVIARKYSDTKQVESPAQIRLDCQQKNSLEVTQSIVSDTVEEILTRTPESMEMPSLPSYQSQIIPNCNQSMEQLHGKATEQEEQPSTAYKDEINGPGESSESSPTVSSSVNEWNNDLEVRKHPLPDENSNTETYGDHQNVEELTKKNLRASSEETFYSWAPGSSSEDPSFHELDISLNSLVTPDNLVTVCDGLERPESRQRQVSKNEDKGCSSRDATSTHSLASIGFPLVLKSSSIDSWVLRTTSGDGVEIRHVRSAMKSEEMSDESCRAVPFDLIDGVSGSDTESNTSLVTTGASDASSDISTRKKWGSKLINKFKKKRPKTPKSGSAGMEPPSQALSDCGMKTSESFIHQNTSFSDEN